MYFARLYPDELLYSGIARSRIHLGLANHKTLLHLLFGNSQISAITDLPSHLLDLADIAGLDAATLLTDHTLFPLYAPFLPRERRAALQEAMFRPGRPTIGLAGCSPALVKWPEMLRYCPVCLSEMSSHLGETYWRRSWQIYGVDVCLEHRCLLRSSSIPFRRMEKHEFQPVAPFYQHAEECSAPQRDLDIYLARVFGQLLQLKDPPSPDYEGWTNFYRGLATEYGATNGQHVVHDVVWERVVSAHRLDWLSAKGLATTCDPPSWVLAIFRKHRKTFSALQHLLIWTTLRPNQSAGELIKEAARCQAQIFTTKSSQVFRGDLGLLRWHRSCWLDALGVYGGAKSARQNGGGARYAWLYRHDRCWLKSANNTACRKHGNNRYLDWRARDKCLVKLLVRIERDTGDNLRLPRRSRSWFIHQLPHHSSVENHLDQLPLCCAFLHRYAESVLEYQIRRLTNEAIEDIQQGRCSKAWELERRCGVGKEKFSSKLRKLLNY